MIKNKDALLINLPSSFLAYSGSRVNVAVRKHPVISLALLAGMLKQKGFNVVVLDLGVEEAPYKKLGYTLEKLKPEIIGITSTTPLFPEAMQTARMIREKLGKEAKIIIGGPHCSALPEESLVTSDFDIAVVGEGEMTMLEIVEGKNLSEIKGIYYKEEEEILSTSPRPLIEDLDSLPFPAFELFDKKRYDCPSVVSRRNPTVGLYTSRGCPYDCSFCGKKVFGFRFRAESPQRVVDEIKYVLELGYGEVTIVDDNFTSDLSRAKTICELILKRGLHFCWSMIAGFRVDCIDREFLMLAKKAGLYRVAIGFESGDQRCLDSCNKGITIKQGIEVMNLVKEAGLESLGYFMLGLPYETEETMKNTINFAIRLMPDFARATIMIPYPDSRIYGEYQRKGLIKSRDWRRYNTHNAGYIYQHPNLDYKKIKQYYNRFYYKFYLNPRWLLRRIRKSLRERGLFSDIRYGFQTFFPSIKT